MEIVEKRIDESKCKYVYTLNTWKDKHFEEAQELLEQGYYVHFGSTAIGHTLSRMVESEGVKMAKDKFGERLEVIEREGYGWLFVHFIEKKARTK